MHPSSFYLIHSFFLHWLLYILVVLYAVSFWLAELITCSHPDGWLLQIFSWRVVLWLPNSKDHSGIFQPLGGPTWFLGADKALKGLFHPFFHCWTNFLSMWSFGLLLPALIPQIYCYNIHYYNILCLFQPQVLLQGGVTFRDVAYHRECFLCTSCDTELANVKFATKEEQPYCPDCYIKTFAKICEKCGQPIAGDELFAVIESF